MEIPEEFNQAIKYVKKHERELRDKYGNDTLAIAGSSGVVDHDKDYGKLMDRIKPDGKILFSTIEHIVNPHLYENPGVELAR